MREIGTLLLTSARFVIAIDKTSWVDGAMPLAVNAYLSSELWQRTKLFPAKKDSNSAPQMS